MSPEHRAVRHYRAVSEIEWLQRWFADQCNGEYEDGPGIRIETLETPGWWLAIDLELWSVGRRSFDDLSQRLHECPVV